MYSFSRYDANCRSTWESFRPKKFNAKSKVGTVTPDLATAVKAAKSGEIQFKAEKAGVVQVGIGKISFDKKKLVENFQAFMNELKKSKPTGLKVYL